MAGKIKYEGQVVYADIENRLLALYRRYYRLQIVQGIIFSVVVFAVLLLVLILYNQWVDSSTIFRKISFLFLCAGGMSMFALLVLAPLIKGLRRRKVSKLKFAESIVRERFPEIQDQLFNLIELKQMSSLSGDTSLIVASIDSRASKIGIFRFNLAVPLRKLFKPVAAVSLILISYLVITLLWPEFIKEGYSKTVRYNENKILRPSVFVQVLNDSLAVGMGDDFTLVAEVKNTVDKGPLYVKIGESLKVMQPSDNQWVYKIESVNGDVNFSFVTGDYLSENYMLRVIPVPVLNSMNIVVLPPAYTGLDRNTLHNEGDLVIAQGSTVEWTITYSNSDYIHMIFYDDTIMLKASSDEIRYKRAFLKSGNYSLGLLSEEIMNKSYSEYSIEVINDQYPVIETSQMTDSALASQVFFQANIEDDYGFSSMAFVVKDEFSGDTIFMENIRITENVKFQRAYYGFDFDSLQLSGKEIQYYFSVWDNDQVNGFKRTDSDIRRKTIYTSEELFESNREKGEKLGESIKESKDVIDELNEKVSDLLNSQIIDNKEDWEIKNKVDEISEMRNVLEDMINNIKNENRVINENDSQVGERMSQLLEKQKQVEELFDKLMDDELRKLFEEFEKLAGEMTKRERIERTEELKLNLENLEEQLDINLELLQKLELEKEVLNIADQLEKLGESVENSPEEISGEELKEKFDELNEKYEEQLEKNKDFKQPEELDPFKEERQELDEQIEKSKEKEGTESDEGQSEETKKDAGKKMQQLGAKMKEQIAAGGGSQNLIDIELIRQLTQELNDYSFRQEELLNEISFQNAQSKKFLEIGVEQRQMELKFDIIRDSLKSLGYKEPMIAGLLNEEVFHVETSLKNMNRSVQDGLVAQVRYEQQKVMEGVNELAVRLDELLDNLNAMSGEGGGESKFKDSNPKPSSKKIGESREKQESLKNQMKQMIQEMKNGMKQGQGGKEMVKMLSEREQLRRALEELRNSGGVGESTKKKLREVENMMEQVEQDIIYNRVDDATISKEEWIQTRLLEAETAEKEREQENKRVSKEFKGVFEAEDLPKWVDFENVNKESGKTLNYSDIKLKEFYRQKYNEYLERLNQRKNGNKIP